MDFVVLMVWIPSHCRYVWEFHRLGYCSVDGVWIHHQHLLVVVFPVVAASLLGRLPRWWVGLSFWLVAPQGILPLTRGVFSSLIGLRQPFRCHFWVLSPSQSPSRQVFVLVPVFFLLRPSCLDGLRMDPVPE